MLGVMNSAREATARLQQLLGREHTAMADFILALADFDRQRLWLELGYNGLFSYLERELGMSKGAAFYRMTAARLVQNFPEAAAALRDGRLCITAVAELAKVLTTENQEEILPRFFHRSKREAKELSAALAPREAPPQRAVVTIVRMEPTERTVQPVEPTHAANGGGAAALALPATCQSAPMARRDNAEPMTADLNRLHITVSRRFLDKLERARAALSHSLPDAGVEQLLEAGLDLVLDRAAKTKGITARPQQKERPSAPGRIPARVKRAVWQRDQGKCQWPVHSGGICGSTVRVEFDHVVPRAMGGPSTVDAVRLLCAVHNALAARRAFGEELMDRFTQRAGRSSAQESG
jgi:hypothetical protein